MRFNIFLEEIWLYLFNKNNDIIATLACNGRVYASPIFFENVQFAVYFDKKG